MNLLQNFVWQAQYNQTMNRQFFAACDPISDADRKRDLGAFFKSIHGTLNHILLADKVWMGRIQNQPFAVKSLDQILHDDFDDLRTERERTDQRILDFVASLSEADLSSTIRYTSIAKQIENALALDQILTHLFLHQTHHRGQVTTLIGQLGYDFGDTDILWSNPFYTD
ncbi:MAG: DinB family protein [Thiomicrospira sp.]|jgi:uncharacterized damage-inducible protein DinB|nr:DinB family protein [Thiomicrospira sp.]